jgi:hypothetical protein
MRDDSIEQKILYVGNSAKSMRISVDASLKKLRTDYIDLLYVHWWDWGTSVEEVMNHLHMLVVQGKVLYLVRLFQLFLATLINFGVYLGSLRHACVGCLEGQPIRSRPWTNAIRDLPRRMERHGAFFRARNYSDGQV